MINLEWFRTFKAIYEVGTLSGAAKSLYISQPGVSLHLNSLETYTGISLFQRDSRKMTPTEQGTLLYNYITDSIRRLSEAETVFHHKSKSRRPVVKIGMRQETFQYALETHISQLPFDLTTSFAGYPQMLQQLNSGTLDLVVTPDKTPFPNVEYTAFRMEKLILVCGSAAPVRDFIDVAATRDNDLIRTWLGSQVWYTTELESRYITEFWIANFGSSPDFKPNYVLPSYTSILRCVRHGIGFAIMPDLFCRKAISNGSIVHLWPESLALDNDLYYGTRKECRYPDQIRSLQGMLAENWSKLSVSE